MRNSAFSMRTKFFAAVLFCMPALFLLLNNNEIFWRILKKTNYDIAVYDFLGYVCETLCRYTTTTIFVAQEKESRLLYLFYYFTFIDYVDGYEREDDDIAFGEDVVDKVELFAKKYNLETYDALWEWLKESLRNDGGEIDA